MRLFLVHQNFPGQFRHLALHCASLPEYEVTALAENKNIARQRFQAPGIRLLGYEFADSTAPDSRDVEHLLHRAIQRGHTIARGAADLRRSGYRPDVVLAHIGWGEAIFLKDVFPEAKILLYCEYFYRAVGGDFGFDPEFPADQANQLALRVMNAPFLMALDASDWGLTPTQWQRSRFPEKYAERISLIHEGIDTDAVTPDRAAFQLPGTGLVLTAADQVVTYAARNLEPHRGFHVFMRALPEIQRRNPKARVVIAGGDEVSYSQRLPQGGTYRARLLHEMHGEIDLSRVHFTGQLAYHDYLKLLRISAAHVYLTYPFVLSWSLLEAMAAGCLVVASRTAPVEEVIRDRENGLLVDFFSSAEIAARVGEALRGDEEVRAIRQRARNTVVEQYDLKRVCLPAQVALIQRLAGR